MDQIDFIELLAEQVDRYGIHVSRQFLPIHDWLGLADDIITTRRGMGIKMPDDLSKLCIEGPNNPVSVLLFVFGTLAPAHDQILEAVAKYDNGRVNYTGMGPKDYEVFIGGHAFPRSPAPSVVTFATSSEPPCLCSSRSLVTIGHEHGCAYMKWKQSGGH